MILYSNNASTTLASGISNSATTITVATGTGSLFPVISSVDDYFNVTITDSAKHIEIVTVTARTGDTFTVIRGMENTTARAWLASDILELRITKGLLDQLKLDATKDTASNLSAHTSNTSNPHSVTATQVGLGNVTNESKATMFTSPTFTGNAVLGTPASGDFSTGTFTWPTFNQNTTGNAATATYATSAGDASTLETHSASYFATASGLSSHTGNTSNPHSVTAAQVGAYTTGSVDTLLAAKVSKTASTGSAVMPSGTTGERDGSPSAGYMRFNSSLAKFEGYNGSAWSSVGGGATGGGSDAIFIENGQTVTTDYTITSGNNAGTFGPVSVNSGVTVTIPSGSVWTIV